jgi:hypothetical protein
MSDLLRHASIVALVSMFMGVVPLTMGIIYAVWPTEQRLALMRPLSLATIFAAVSGTAVGMLNVFRYIGLNEPPAFSRIAFIGLAESLVSILMGFGCLTVAWLCVALGMWRRP